MSALAVEQLGHDFEQVTQQGAKTQERPRLSVVRDLGPQEARLVPAEKINVDDIYEFAVAAGGKVVDTNALRHIQQVEVDLPDAVARFSYDTRTGLREDLGEVNVYIRSKVPLKTGILDRGISLTNPSLVIERGSAHLITQHSVTHAEVQEPTKGFGYPEVTALVENHSNRIVTLQPGKPMDVQAGSRVIRRPTRPVKVK